MMVLPSVTWPSPPMTTWLPRLNETIVVPRYCSMGLFCYGLKDNLGAVMNFASSINPAVIPDVFIAPGQDIP
jgi:hypothetical protein